MPDDHWVQDYEPILHLFESHLFICMGCSSVVAFPIQHDQWHKVTRSMVPKADQ